MRYGRGHYNGVPGVRKLGAYIDYAVFFSFNY
jgi:hypothetical protein